jgi:crossover junction endodeoxyribonuclease RuvC
LLICRFEQGQSSRVRSGQRISESASRLILGLDPGLSATGFAIIDAAQPTARPLALGDIRTRQSDPVGKRLRTIHAAVEELVARHRPAVVSIEALFTRVNVRTVLQMAQARGVALLAATSQGAELFEYSPAEIKKLVAGSGRAGKDQMMAMVRALVALPRASLSEHAADALAAALCHRQHLNLGGRTSAKASRRGKRRLWQAWLEKQAC